MRAVPLAPPDPRGEEDADPCEEKRVRPDPRHDLQRPARRNEKGRKGQGDRPFSPKDAPRDEAESHQADREHDDVRRPHRKDRIRRRPHAAPVLLLERGDVIADLVGAAVVDGVEGGPVEQAYSPGNVDGKRIDIFALDFRITGRGFYLAQFIESFYDYPKSVGERPVRVDIVMLYDASKLRRVVHRYEGRPGLKRDGFVFKDPERKRDALWGVVKVL